MKRWLIPVLVVVVVAVGVGGFFAGKAAGKQPTTGLTGVDGYGARTRPGGYGFPGGAGAATGGFASGSIVRKDQSGITIKLSDGNTKIIILSAATPVTETKDVSATALAVGQQVTVSGTTNTDGSITAQRVMLGEALGGLAGQNGTPGAGQPPTGSSPPTT